MISKTHNLYVIFGGGAFVLAMKRVFAPPLGFPRI